MIKAKWCSMHYAQLIWIIKKKPQENNFNNYSNTLLDGLDYIGFLARFLIFRAYVY